jgi:hypothetical protein
VLRPAAAPWCCALLLRHGAAPCWCAAEYARLLKSSQDLIACSNQAMAVRLLMLAVVCALLLRQVWVLPLRLAAAPWCAFYCCVLLLLGENVAPQGATKSLQEDTNVVKTESIKYAMRDTRIPRHKFYLLYD